MYFQLHLDQTNKKLFSARRKFAARTIVADVKESNYESFVIYAAISRRSVENRSARRVQKENDIPKRRPCERRKQGGEKAPATILENRQASR